jgi:hypothetical protein
MYTKSTHGMESLGKQELGVKNNEVPFLNKKNKKKIFHRLCTSF